FNPQVGFVRRPGRRLIQELVQLRPHFEKGSLIGNYIRDITVTASDEYAILSDGRTESKTFTGPSGTVEFQDGGTINYSYYRTFDRLIQPFVVGGLRIPIGDYLANGYTAGYSSSKRRAVSASINLQRQDYFGGTQTLWTWGGLVRASYRLSVQPSYQR